MRGKGYTTAAESEENRITPAYAGKSNCRKDMGKGGLGSPPPMRGKVCTTPPMLFVYRITPAYAGKSS